MLLAPINNRTYFVRPDLDEVKARLSTLGTEHVFTEEELGKLDKKSLLVPPSSSPISY